MSEEAAHEEELRVAEAAAAEEGPAETCEPGGGSLHVEGEALPAGSRIFFIAKADGKEERSAPLRIGHLLEGMIKDGNGETVADAELMLLLQTGETLRGTSDREGRFVFHGLPETQVILVAAAKPLKEKLTKLQKVSFLSSPVMAAACVVTRTSYHGFGIKWSFPPDAPEDSFFGRPWELAWLDGLQGTAQDDWEKKWNEGVVATVLGPRMGATETDCGVMLGGRIKRPEGSEALHLVDLFAKA